MCLWPRLDLPEWHNAQVPISDSQVSKTNPGYADLEHSVFLNLANQLNFVSYET